MKNRILLLAITVILCFPALLIAQTSYKNLSQSTIDTDQLPIRDVRKTAIWFGMGWNGLTGFGPAVSIYPVPKVATDIGIGLSSEGLKMAIRARYLFSVKNFTPFVGLGFLNGLGSITDFELSDTYNNNEKFRIRIENSPYIQLSGGFEYMAKKGFFTLFNLGYAVLLKNNNYIITSGNPSSDTRKALDIAYGSGIVFEGGIGYAF